MSQFCLKCASAFAGVAAVAAIPVLLFAATSTPGWYAEAELIPGALPHDNIKGRLEVASYAEDSVPADDVDPSYFDTDWEAHSEHTLHRLEITGSLKGWVEDDMQSLKLTSSIREPGNKMTFSCKGKAMPSGGCYFKLLNRTKGTIVGAWDGGTVTLDQSISATAVDAAGVTHRFSLNFKSTPGATKISESVTWTGGAGQNNKQTVSASVPVDIVKVGAEVAKTSNWNGEVSRTVSVETVAAAPVSYSFEYKQDTLSEFAIKVNAPDKKRMRDITMSQATVYQVSVPGDTQVFSGSTSVMQWDTTTWSYVILPYEAPPQNVIDQKLESVTN